MSIREVANWCAGVAALVGLVGYVAFGSNALGFLFLGGSLFLFSNSLLRWMVFGNRTSWPKADDMRRADDPSHDQESSILPAALAGPVLVPPCTRRYLSRRHQIPTGAKAIRTAASTPMATKDKGDAHPECIVTDRGKPQPG